MFEGTGLAAKDFQPIVVMVEVLEKLSATEDRAKANHVIKEFCSDTTNATRIKASAKAGYGPFSAKVGFQKDLSQHDTSKDYFENDEEFRAFKSTAYSEQGKKPRFYARSLGLVELGRAQQAATRSVTAVVYSPTAGQSSLLLTARMGAGAPAQQGRDFNPIGCMVPFAGQTTPPGYLLCDGAYIDPVVNPAYDALAQLLGSTFGPVNIKAVKLPDLRGRVPMGAGTGLTVTKLDGTGTPLTARVVGTALGEEAHTMTIAELVAHDHGGSTSQAGEHVHSHSASLGDLDNDHNHNRGRRRYGEWNGHNTNPAGIHSHTIPTAGGGQPMPVIQPALVVNYIIKF